MLHIPFLRPPLIILCAVARKTLCTPGQLGSAKFYLAFRYVPMFRNVSWTSAVNKVPSKTYTSFSLHHEITLQAVWPMNVYIGNRPLVLSDCRIADFNF